MKQTTTEEDLTRIALQEQALRYERLDAEAAWRLGARLRAMAAERGHAVVIDIRRWGLPLFYACMEATTPDNPEWVRRKSNTVARWYRSSYAIGLELAAKSTTLAAKYGVPESDYAAHGGSFPLTVAGAVVGAVTVSGLPQRADHELVVEALCAELGHSHADLRLA